MMDKQMMLAVYIAIYIHEELKRGASLDDINTHMILNAIQAYEGGAGDD